jgi:hypothetical protein
LLAEGDTHSSLQMFSIMLYCLPCNCSAISSASSSARPCMVPAWSTQTNLRPCREAVACLRSSHPANGETLWRPRFENADPEAISFPKARRDRHQHGDPGRKAFSGRILDPPWCLGIINAGSTVVGCRLYEPDRKEHGAEFNMYSI